MQHIPVPRDWQDGPAAYDDPLGYPVLDPIATVLDEPYHVSSRNKKDKMLRSSEPIPTTFKGYTLRKLPALSGAKAHWGRVGKREIDLSSKELQQMARAHLKGRLNALQDAYKGLTSSQQAVVNNVIEEHKDREKYEDAEWVLADVHRYGPSQFGRLIEVNRIDIVLKRQDRNNALLSSKTTGAPTTFYPEKDIIDIRSLGREKSSKSSKKHATFREESGSHNRAPDIFDEIVREEPRRSDRHQTPAQPPYQQPFEQPYQQPQQQQQQYQPQYPDPMVPPAVPTAPPYADPVTMALLPQTNLPHDRHPFEPLPGVLAPLQYDTSYPYHDRPGPREITPMPVRNTSHGRRSSSAKRMNRVVDENRRLEAQVDELRERLENLPLSSDTSGASARERARERADAWSDGGATRSPMSSPPRSEDLFYEQEQRKRDRNASRYHEKGRYPGEERTQRYRDGRTEVHIHTTTTNHRARQPAERRHERDEYNGRYSSRARVHRAHTMQDYPLGSLPQDQREPRYIAPPALHRQITDYPEAVPYAEYTTDHGRRQNEQDGRQEQFHDRRREYVEVGGTYYG
ncbi:hypothetical protein LTR62_000125 [Meristemomyces frigidus]|uniref:Uncharacterized protein n=1 Tax=Meristemomyces frigidus TaxID=1508187 RepID=A0AAN7TYR8_9PEZI|nr:hypothetical protein LTR62_000125 [Meristemomyces frigidus]